MYNIRKATVEDVPFITTKVAPAMAALYGEEDIVDVHYVAWLAEQLISIEKTVFIAECDGECVGIIGGKIAQFVYNPSISVMHELVWWVDDQHRTSSVGGRLLLALEKEAKEHECIGLVLSIMPSTQLNGKTLLNAGFNPKEVSLLKRFGDR